MNSFKNNHRRNRFRSNGDRNYKKRNGESRNFNSDYTTSLNFHRKAPGKNNHNAPKLVEKYNDLAREALSKGDKILSENYFQHADHFMRVVDEKNLNQNKISIQVKDESNISEINSTENNKIHQDKDIKEKKE